MRSAAPPGNARKTGPWNPREETDMPDDSRITLEVAVETLADAVAAEAAGADRIELSVALDVDGLTPPVELMREVRGAVRCPLLALVRCRGGDYHCEEEEVTQMVADAGALCEFGAGGVVFGALVHGGRVDKTACRRVMSALGGRPAVFHRAFDETRDPFSALETLIAMGFSRVLTSGRSACAADAEALTLLRRLREQADGRIEILPGGGVRPHNVAEIVAATGCTQVHSSARRRDPHTGIEQFDAGVVAELRKRLDGG